jgi:hypothetical protein
MDNNNNQFQRLNAIFEGDGAEIRQQFIYAGLLLTIFERFKSYIVDQEDGFFSNHIEIKKDTLKYTRGEEFKEAYKGKGRVATGPARQSRIPCRPTLVP